MALCQGPYQTALQLALLGHMVSLGAIQSQHEAIWSHFICCAFGDIGTFVDKGFQIVLGFALVLVLLCIDHANYLIQSVKIDPQRLNSRHHHPIGHICYRYPSQCPSLIQCILSISNLHRFSLFPLSWIFCLSSQKTPAAIQTSSFQLQTVLLLCLFLGTLLLFPMWLWHVYLRDRSLGDAIISPG